MTNYRMLVSAAALTLAASGAQSAELPAWIQEIELNGMVSASYSYNENQPANRTNNLRNYDFDDNTLKLDLAQLVIQKPVEKPRDAGFRVDLTYGHSVPPVMALAAGEAGALTGATADEFQVQQGYVTYIAPIGAGLTLDFGRWGALPGYEATPGYEGFNEHFSTSNLCTFLEPGLHFGLRASYPISEMISATMFVANGWEIVQDNNSDKTFGAQLSAKPIENVEIIGTVVNGAERANNNKDDRTLYDVILNWIPMDRVLVGAHYASLKEDNVLGAGLHAKASGVAAYVKYDFTEKLSVAGRYDVLRDLGGRRVGVAAVVPQNSNLRLSEFTVTPAYKLTEQLTFRAEARFDRANYNVYTDRATANIKRRQTTYAVNAIYVF